ncbi:hypothetical protein MTO96_047198 [Rhipicephalus appendiculatus]
MTSENDTDDEALHSDDRSEDRSRGARSSVEDEHQSSSSEADSHNGLDDDRTFVPPFDESDLLAKCIDDFGRLLYLNSAPDVERTTLGMRRDMSLAARLKTPVNGLKGMSPLTKLAHFDLVWGYTVE